MTGKVCWLELNSPNAIGSKSFYRDLFGWVEIPGDVGFPYHFLRHPAEEKNFGGIMPQNPETAIPPHWLVYFAVENLESSVKKVLSLGGQVRVPLVTLPGGKFSILSDPQGAAFALFQSTGM